ncbi:MULTISPECIES: hypothetical protein [unclassified Microbispora]|nr:MULTISPECIES: hypothetical protein [unclassified Microbispora]
MIDMEAHIRAVVRELGPPTPEQIARLRLIFAGASVQEAADAA